MTAEELDRIIQAELALFEDSEKRERIRSRLVSPEEQTRIFEYHLENRRYNNGQKETHACYLVCDLRERRGIVVLYAAGGWGKRGCFWGLSSRNTLYTGPLDHWYPTLRECIYDYGPLDEEEEMQSGE